MYFIFSKLLLVFTYPFMWFLAFLIASFMVKKKPLKRRFFITSMILLFVFSNPLLFNLFAKYWNIKPVPLRKQPYSCVIVLGGFSKTGTNGNGIFDENADRFIQAVKLWSEGRASHIMISGGNGNLIPGKFYEADWAKTQLEALNVPDSCILIEDRSRNTKENADFSKIILTKAHLAPPYILVTSAFHMRRALGIFKRRNIDVVPYPCYYYAGEGKISWVDLVPDAEVFTGWSIYIKEAIGHVVNNIL
jgi:uncharacterized SAM-binding protein YcdF (DUF218 family)